MKKKTPKTEDINVLREKYGNEKMWVNYRILRIGGRATKIPYSPITKQKASSTDKETWGTYEEALTFDAQHLGIVFTPEQKLLGIDLDHCLEGGEGKDALNLTGPNKEVIAGLIIEADTYTEISPSKTGLHLYFEISDAPLALDANRHEQFEAYTSGRYFTSTNVPYKEALPVRTITKDEALTILSMIGYPWGKVTKQDEATLPLASAKSSEKKPSGTNADSADLLKKMFRSKNGKLVKELYDGKATASTYNNDDSAADLALLSHFAFWTNRSASLMESLWLNSPQGQREKTQKRKDYRDRSIATAISHCKTTYENKNAALNKEIEDNAPELDLLYTTIRGDKIFTQNTENMCRILRHHKMFKGNFRYDNFKNTLEIKENDAWRLLEDHDTVNTQTAISILFPMFGKVGKEMIYDAIVKVSREEMVDTAIDYIKAIKWDGTDRLKDWIKMTYNTDAKDDKYHSAVGANWMKGLVKRICQPGCKFDYVLVLEGEQGIKKSTSLGVLGNVYPDQPSWHVETTMSTENKDFFMQFQGKAIIEFSEGETLSRTEVKRMKGIITTQSDKYRPAYGRLSVDFPRRCVFAMTTNQSEYLKDETGNRRWLPVACIGNANIAWLQENRDQLFAEAYHRVIEKNESTWEFPEEETFAMQAQRRIQSPSRDLIADWFYNKLTVLNRNDGVTVNQVYRDAIHGGFQSRPLSRFDEMEIADVLKTFLKMEKRRTMVGGLQSNRWYLTAESPQNAPSEPGDALDLFVEDIHGAQQKF